MLIFYMEAHMKRRFSEEQINLAARPHCIEINGCYRET